ncbi:hypothetical protein V493_06489 [Pseudogymnoascus sp. VKM F-4281 (FW-2241)]|nr:hypothetical protein V493_06489 [Pseudogymnoascus sp. VKM F-4281 (FW-2241)]
MSSTSPESHITVIDSKESLIPLLDSITSLAVEPPSLYINLEGIAVGRNGSISILSLHIAPTRETYLIDIHSLQKTAFSTTTASGNSLKNILESPTIPKVIFDIRNDSDALFNLFQISVDGIKDLYLMERAARNGSWETPSLTECVEKDRSRQISNKERTEWQKAKEDGRRVIASEKSGPFEVLNERPMKPEIIKYCQMDVLLFRSLYDIYSAAMRRKSHLHRWDSVLEETNDRIKESQNPLYDTHSDTKYFWWDDGSVCKRIYAWSDSIVGVAEAYEHAPDEDLSGLALQCYEDSLGDMDGFHEDDVKKPGRRQYNTDYSSTIPTL